MTLNLDHYRVQVKAIKLQTEKLSPEERMQKIGELAVFLPCPVVAVSYYIAELYGMDEALQAKIDKDTAWYNLDGVEGYIPYGV